MLIDGEPQGWRAGSGMTHGVMPSAFALLGDLTVLEEGLEEFVCVRRGPVGIFRDSHFVAFLWKVMGGQGYVGVSRTGVSR